MQGLRFRVFGFGVQSFILITLQSCKDPAGQCCRVVRLVTFDARAQKPSREQAEDVLHEPLGPRSKRQLTRILSAQTSQRGSKPPSLKPEKANLTPSTVNLGI